MVFGTNNVFDIPVVMFIFKREEKAKTIIDRLSAIKPQKVYLIGDGPRNEGERIIIEQCRKSIENHISWDCEVVKNYADTNRGVYENIAGGAKWVFEREKWAIFLEDDNLPELSFFPFCQELLRKYESDTRVIWICGTNYLKEWEFPGDSSYFFTHHMMPCGWASWSTKFNKFYDGNLELWENPIINKLVREQCYYKKLKAQDIRNWDRELRRRKKGLKFDSWDYQMSFSLRAHNLYGIVPKYNQICNIGVDPDSVHGGTTFNNVMTRRFCGLSTKSIEVPLKHPLIISIDPIFEKRTASIITVPLQARIRGIISSFIKKLLFISPDESLTKVIQKKLNVKKHTSPDKHFVL